MVGELTMEDPPALGTRVGQSAMAGMLAKAVLSILLPTRQRSAPPSWEASPVLAAPSFHVLPPPRDADGNRTVH